MIRVGPTIDQVKYAKGQSREAYACRFTFDPVRNNEGGSKVSSRIVYQIDEINHVIIVRNVTFDPSEFLFEINDHMTHF